MNKSTKYNYVNGNFTFNYLKGMLWSKKGFKRKKEAVFRIINMTEYIKAPLN